MTPIVLLQGIARFDALTNRLARRFQTGRLGRWFDRYHYFKEIRTFLLDSGYPTYHTEAPFAASVAQRGESIANQVKRIVNECGTKAHLIGHSMGGLDARYAIVRAGLDQYVETLSTIGTPHMGTSFADWAMERDGLGVIVALKPFIDLEGFEELTREAARVRNAAFSLDESSNSIEYRVYGACKAEAQTFLPLQASWRIISQEEGANDGLVSLDSQLWRPRLGSKKIWQYRIPFPLDHLNECGWPSGPRDATSHRQVQQLYLGIAAGELVDDKA